MKLYRGLSTPPRLLLLQENAPSTTRPPTGSSRITPSNANVSAPRPVLKSYATRYVIAAVASKFSIANVAVQSGRVRSAVAAGSNPFPPSSSSRAVMS